MRIYSDKDICIFNHSRNIFMEDIINLMKTDIKLIYRESNMNPITMKYDDPSIVKEVNLNISNIYSYNMNDNGMSLLYIDGKSQVVALNDEANAEIVSRFYSIVAELELVSYKCLDYWKTKGFLNEEEYITLENIKFNKYYGGFYKNDKQFDRIK